MAIEAIISCIASVVGIIVWLIRLEGRVNYNEKMLVNLESKHSALDEKIMSQLSQVRESLARIEGRLSRESHDG